MSRPLSMAHRRVRALVLVLAAVMTSPCLADKPVFRAISANAAPASQARAPGQLYRLPEKAGQIRAVNGTRDQILVTTRVVVAPPAAAAPPPATPMPVPSAADPEMTNRLAQDLAAMNPTPTPIANTSAAMARRPVRLTVPLEPKPPAPAPVVAAAGGKGRGKSLIGLDTYRDLISTAARTHGVDEALVRAVIHAESAFRPNAVSHAGAGGLMQLMPATARRFGVEDRFDAQQNIDGGTRYLAWLLRRYNGDVTLATAAYNAGEGAVDKYRGVPPYRETRGYVVKVADLFQNYSLAMTGDFGGFFRTASLASTSRAMTPAYVQGVRVISSRAP